MRQLVSNRRVRGFGCLGLAVTLLTLVGCFRVHVIVPITAPSDAHSQWVNGFLWGAVGGSVDTARFCGPRPVARVSTKHSAGTIFITFLTLGIYTPSHVTVVCGQP